MAFMWAVEMVLAALLVYGWVTQVLLPLYRNIPLFPLFWSHETRLQQEERKVQQQIAEDEIAARVKELRRQKETGKE